MENIRTSLENDGPHLRLYMSKTFLLPISIEIVWHELVVSEGDLFVAESGLNLLGVGAAVHPVETDPLSAGVDTPRLTSNTSTGEQDPSSKHPQYKGRNSDRD